MAKLCLFVTPMDCSTPGFPFFHLLSELTQTHFNWAGDAIQPSCPLSSPSPPAFNLSQHQSLPMSRLFTSSGQHTRASASILPVAIQGWFPLGLTGLTSLQSKGLSRVFSSTTIWDYSLSIFTHFLGLQLKQLAIFSMRQRLIESLYRYPYRLQDP